MWLWTRHAQNHDALAAADSDQAQMTEEFEAACVKHLDPQSCQRGGADAPPIPTRGADEYASSADRASQRSSLLVQLHAECPVLMRKESLLRSYFAAHPPPLVKDLAALASATSAAPTIDGPRVIRALQFFAHCLSSQVELMIDFTAGWGEVDSLTMHELALERAQEAYAALLAALTLLRDQEGSIELRASSATAAPTSSQELLQRTWTMLAAVCLRLGKSAEALEAAGRVESYLLSIKASELSSISAVIDGRIRAFSVQRWFDRLGSVLRLKSAAQTQLGSFAASAATDRAHLALLAELSAFLSTGLTRDEKDRSRMPARVELAYLLKALPVATHLSHALLQQAQAANDASSVALGASSSAVADSHRASRASLAIVRGLSSFYYCSPSFEDLALATAARANGRQELARTLQSKLEQQGCQLVQQLEHIHADDDEADDAEEETEAELEEVRTGVSFFLTTHGGPPIDPSTRELATSWRLKPALLLMQVAAAFHQRSVVVTTVRASSATSSSSSLTTNAPDSVSLSFASLRPDLSILQRMTAALDSMEDRVAARLQSE